jgi:Arc/MetJ-type ribon-helix-helix transcriptional regulator
LVKRKVSVTIDPETAKWVDKQIQEKRFADFSHAVDLALAMLKHSDEKRPSQ